MYVTLVHAQSVPLLQTICIIPEGHVVCRTSGGARRNNDSIASIHACMTGRWSILTTNLTRRDLHPLCGGECKLEVRSGLLGEEQAGAATRGLV
jgi:hypothetical protein